MSLQELQVLRVLLVLLYLPMVLVVPAVSLYPAAVFVLPFLAPLCLAAVLTALSVPPYLPVEALGFPLVHLGLPVVYALFGQVLLYLAAVLLRRAGDGAAAAAAAAGGGTSSCQTAAAGHKLEI